MVITADLSSWEALLALGAALRKNEIDVVRFTGTQASSAQRGRVFLERLVFNRTHAVLDPEPDGAVDVRPIEASLVDARDVQAVDSVAMALAGRQTWNARPDLRRVHRPALDDVALFDKWVYGEALRAAGVAVPRAWPSPEQAPGNTELMVKARTGAGGDHVYSAIDREEAANIIAGTGQSAETFFVQEKLTGTVWGVAGVAHKGRVLVSGSYQAIPASDDPAGPPVAARLAHRPDLEDATRQVCEVLGYSGPFQLDLLDRQPAAPIDFNARFFGSWSALQANGVDLLGAYLDHLGIPQRWVPPSDPTKGEVFPTIRGQSRGVRGWRQSRDLVRRLGPVLGWRWGSVELAQSALNTVRPH